MCFARYAPLEDQDTIVGLMNFLKASSHEHGDDFVEHTFNLCGAECHAAVFAGMRDGRNHRDCNTGVPWRLRRARPIIAPCPARHVQSTKISHAWNCKSRDAFLEV